MGSLATSEFNIYITVRGRQIYCIYVISMWKCFSRAYESCFAVSPSLASDACLTIYNQFILMLV